MSVTTEDLRTFYDAYYDGYDMPPFEQAPNALTIRLRLALAALDEDRAVRSKAFYRLPLKERLRMLNEAQA